MKFKKTTALKKILALKKRLKIIQGGSAAGKTIAVILIFIDRCQCEKNKLFSIVSESMPHLKRGAIRDFLNIMENQKYYSEEKWNRTDFIYTFETGSRLEFFSADQSSKVRGPRRDNLFINEANNINLETYTQLAIRTNEYIYLDYNPVSEFWVHEDILEKQDNDFIILTYKDNEGLAQSIVKEIESRKGLKNFWQVYGLGQLGEIEGKIYNGWKIIDEIPHEAKLQRYGLNFGYTNHPAGLVAIYLYNGGYIIDEILYGRGLTNQNIADTLKNHDKALVVADSAEPKSIDEIKSYGINIIGCKKKVNQIYGSLDIGSEGSYVKWSIGIVQAEKVSMTSRSVNVIKEYRNYLWLVDKNGRVMNVPEEPFHYIMDAVRYGICSLAPIINKEEFRSKIPIFRKDPKPNPGR